ncbi:MAG: MBL fold metallo-hydrolase [bacterium]
MWITQINRGPFQNNLYLVGADQGDECAAIDPAWVVDELIALAGSRGKRITKILQTHGHIDHAIGVQEMRRKTGAPVYGHPDEHRLFQENDASFLEMIGVTWEPIVLDVEYRDGDTVLMGLRTDGTPDEFRIVHTPGHTPGGVCLVSDDFMVAGDTLFAGSVGRWDFPGGNGTQLFESIHTRLLTLPESLRFYPGHGPSSTIGEEKRYNPYLQMSAAQLGVGQGKWM